MSFSRRTWTTFAAFVVLFADASAGLLAEPSNVDGVLDEAHWRTAVWKPCDLAGATCAFLGDEQKLQVGVRSAGTNAVCITLAPDGTAFSFYRFTVGSDGELSADFASEGGNIHPDPFSPEWTAKRQDGEVEYSIPLAAFYMTRQKDWKENWQFAVSSGPVPAKRLRRGTGFPMRTRADDVGLTDAFVSITNRTSDGTCVGVLTVTVTADLPGAYVLRGDGLAPTGVRIRSERTRVTAPCAYPSPGTRTVRLELVRESDSSAYARRTPVSVSFEPIRVRLTAPAYRDNFYPGQDASRVAGRIESRGRASVRLSLQGSGFAQRTMTLPPGGGDFSFDTTGFAEGEAHLRVEAGTDVKDVRIRRLAPTGHRMAWIENGHLVVDGRPVFRRNLYAEGYHGGQAFDEKWRKDNLHCTVEFRGNGTIAPGRLMPADKAREERRDVMPCAEYLEKIRARVEEARGRDFAAWYICDEPECRGVSPVYLRHVYEYMKEIDPYHLVFMASRGGARYIDCADWFETHPYINPRTAPDGHRTYGTPIERVGDYLDAFGAWGRPDKCVGFLPTCFAYRYLAIENDYPTFREYVCHVWAAMIRGAKSLYPYAYHDIGDRPALYEGTRYVFSSAEELETPLLLGRRRELLRTDAVEAALWETADERLLVVLNKTQEPQHADVPGVTGSFAEFRGTRTFRGRGRTMSFALAPHEVLIGTTANRGKNLPTFAATAALIDRLEKERRGRDSQLCERYGDVTVTGSKPTGSGYKLFDGVRDVIAWNQEWGDAYVELAFQKMAVFSKVRVFGRWKNGPVVEVWRQGAWIVPEVRKTEGVENGCEITLAETIRTVKLRLSFKCPAKGRNSVELYEIELPAAAASTPVREVQPSPKPIGASWVLEPEKFCQHWNPRVRLDPDFPWFTVRLDSFSPIDRKRYLAWSLYAEKDWLMGTVTHPQAGLYTVRHPVPDAKERGLLKFYNYGFELGVGYVANERRPANRLELIPPPGCTAIGPGDTFTVALDLADPCEEVSAVFLWDHGKGRGLQPFSVNGSDVVDLRRVDAAGCSWRSEIAVKSCGGTEKQRPAVRVTLLGGSLSTPIFTFSPVPFVKEHVD